MKYVHIQAYAPCRHVVILLRSTKTDRQESVVGTGNNRLEGLLGQAVYSGMSTTYKVDVQGREVTVFEQNKRASSLTPGTTVRLEWTPDHSVVVQP